MTAHLPTDLIVQLCEDKKWQYPQPVENPDEWLAKNRDVFDPADAHRSYWPDRPYQQGMEILIVDGGTNQGPVIARSNPAARVAATVLNDASLAHAIYLRHKFGLRNLDLHLLPTEEVSSLNRSFDLVIASGALQTTGNDGISSGMRALAQVVRSDGVAAFLLYSRYLPNNPEVGYLGEGAGCALHARGDSLTAEDCVHLVESAGMVFQDWLIKAPYHFPSLAAPESELLDAIGRLPERQMWSVMEPLRNQSGCHVFTACQPERPTGAYKVDFTKPAALDYVPGWQLHAGIDKHHAVRPGYSMPLDSGLGELAKRIDGFLSIREIAGQPELESAAVRLVRELWRMDFVVIGMPPATQ